MGKEEDILRNGGFIRLDRGRDRAPGGLGGNIPRATHRRTVPRALPKNGFRILIRSPESAPTLTRRRCCDPFRVAIFPPSFAHTQSAGFYYYLWASHCGVYGHAEGRQTTAKNSNRRMGYIPNSREIRSQKRFGAAAGGDARIILSPPTRRTSSGVARAR